MAALPDTGHRHGDDGLEVFFCPITSQIMKDPVVDPEGNSYERAAIEGWLRRNTTSPITRSPLRPEDLVPNRALRAAIELQREGHAQRANVDDGTQQCREHSLPYTYFCSTCSAPLCSGAPRKSPCPAPWSPAAIPHTWRCAHVDCAILASAHRGHSIDRLDNVYSSHRQRVAADVDKVRDRLADLGRVRHDIEANIELVNDHHEVVVTELNAAFKEVLARLQAQLAQKLVTLVRQKEEVRADEDAALCVVHSEKQLANAASMPAFIAASEQLCSSARQACQKSLVDPAADVVPHNDFICELTPPWEGAHFRLHKYSVLRENARGEASEALYSQPFISSSGLTWRLKVYPNGNGVAKDMYLSVFVELTHAHSEHNVAQYEYRIEMLSSSGDDERPQPQMVREYSVSSAMILPAAEAVPAMNSS
jgi:hypothetical protein